MENNENNYAFIFGTILLTIITSLIMTLINLNTNVHEQQILDAISTHNKQAVKIDKIIEFGSAYDIRYKYKTKDSNKKIPSGVIFNKEDVDDDLSIAFDEQTENTDDINFFIFMALATLVPFDIISFLACFDLM